MEGSLGLEVEERIGMLEIVSSILSCAQSLLLQEKSPEISSNYGKLWLITENFGTLGSKFPDNIG